MNRRLLPVDQSWPALRDGFEWDIPEMFNIAERCCDSWARETPDKIALIDASDGDKTWRFGALKEASDKLATVFAAQGVARGDRVAVLLPQGPAVLIAHFAAYKLGAVVLPLFTLFGPDALQFRLADSGSVLVVTDDEGATKLAALRPSLPDLRAVLSISGGPGAPFWQLIDYASPLKTPVATRAEDPAALIYTSGTTGPPKGVLHAHRFLLGHLPSIELTHPDFPEPGDCGWTPADWAWIGGLMDLAIPCLYYGVPVVSLRMAKFDAGAAWDLIARLGVRNLFLPPTALKLMRQVPVPSGVNVRSISSGGEALGTDLLDWGRQALGVEIAEVYGQTECNLVIASVPGLTDAVPGVMGKPVPGCEMSLRDPDGRAVPDGTAGEICVRRGMPAMMLKYIGNPKATAEKFHGDWMRTGDLAIRDAQGRYRFMSRDDDVITSSGYRIGPSEIENCLNGHPDVVMSAVVGVPDPDRTEIVVAYVVLSEGAQWPGLEAELRDRVARRISPHVAPRRIERADSLPMTATGKILRRALRDRGGAV